MIKRPLAKAKSWSIGFSVIAIFAAAYVYWGHDKDQEFADSNTLRLKEVAKRRGPDKTKRPRNPDKIKRDWSTLAAAAVDCDQASESLFFAALSSNRFAEAKAYITSCGYDVNAPLKTLTQDTPLIQFSSANNYLVTSFLLAHGANPNIPSPKGAYALERASLWNHVDLDMIIQLVEAGADLEKASFGKSTALCSAAGAGKISAVKFLLAKGARLSPQVGSRAMDCAKARNQNGVVEFLEAY